MDQRYTVFISEGRFEFADGTIPPENGGLHLVDPTAEEMNGELGKLENGEQSTVFISGDLMENWQRFLSFYKIIEAAGGLVQNADGNFLFIHRLEKWDLPKGKLEKGETVEQGAVREVEEECGISGVQISGHIIDTYHTYLLKGKRILKRTYWYAMKYHGTESLIPQGEEGITDAVWLSSEQAEKALMKSYSSIVRVWESAECQ